MKVVWRLPLQGELHGKPAPKVGDLVELPDDAAAHYCQLRYADPAPDKDQDVEKAVADAKAETRGTMTTQSAQKRTRKAD